jgi:hypothetical protein
MRPRLRAAPTAGRQPSGRWRTHPWAAGASLRRQPGGSSARDFWSRSFRAALPCCAACSPHAVGTHPGLPGPGMPCASARWTAAIGAAQRRAALRKVRGRQKAVAPSGGLVAIVPDTGRPIYGRPVPRSVCSATKVREGCCRPANPSMGRQVKGGRFADRGVLGRRRSAAGHAMRLGMDGQPKSVIYPFYHHRNIKHDQARSRSRSPSEKYLLRGHRAHRYHPPRPVHHLALALPPPSPLTTVSPISPSPCPRDLGPPSSCLAWPIPTPKQLIFAIPLPTSPPSHAAAAARPPQQASCPSLSASAAPRHRRPAIRTYLHLLPRATPSDALRAVVCLLAARPRPPAPPSEARASEHALP